MKYDRNSCVNALLTFCRGLYRWNMIATDVLMLCLHFVVGFRYHKPWNLRPNSMKKHSHLSSFIDFNKVKGKIKSDSPFNNAITKYLIAKPEQRSNLSLANNYNTASDNNKRCYLILTTDFREEEFWSEEYFDFWLALTVFPSSQCTRDYRIREGFMLAHEEESCFFLHEHFLLCSNDKDIPTLKTMATYFYSFGIFSWKCENC